MPNENEQIVEKTISTDMMLTGGRLNPVQQDAFVQLVKDNSVMLAMVRYEQMAVSRKQIDKLYIGEPVTAGIAENICTNNDSRTVFDQVNLNADKLKSDWSITTETLQENIEGENFEDTVMDMMTKRIATDIELLGIQGDTNITPGTPLTNLLSVADGWDKLTDSSHLLDAAGATIEKEIFAGAIRKMPEQYLQDPDLRWFMPRSVATDWAEYLASRETVGGDAALSGNSMRPFGYPVTIVPNMPQRKPLAAGAATPALVTGGEFAPYEVIAGVNDAVTINVDGGGNVAVTIPAGVYTVVEFIPVLRAAMIATGATGIAASAALNMYDDGEGRVVFQTVATGAASSIQFVAVANDMYDELGVTAATTTGADSGGDTNDGTIMWLANPRNFIYGMVDDTRIYTEFNKDCDRHEFVIYNQVAYNIENTDAIVKVINLKRG